jgi:hypothetical protein
MATTMDRRLLLAALACWPAAALLAPDEAARPRHKVSAGELYKVLSARFPLRLGFGGILELQVSAPRLLLQPARNRLGAALQAQAVGPALQQLPAGEVELVFALRYEPADQSIRAYRPEILDVQWPGAGPETLQALQSVMPAMARHVGELVLHRFTPRELALPDTMGFEPEEITVVDDGLVVFFGPKGRR